MKTGILQKSQEYLWDEFVLVSKIGTIHQSSAWAHFQEKIAARGKYWIVALEENEKIIGGSLIIRHKMPKGYTWFYASRGPILDYWKSSEKINEEIAAIMEVLKPIAKQENAIFVRMDPHVSSAPLFKGFKQNCKGFYPQTTLILDLTKSEEELLSEMKPKGRYNIHIAEKKGVKIIKSDPMDKNFIKDLENFYKILDATAARDGFHVHDRAFYETMLKELKESKNTFEKSGPTFPSTTLYLAEYENKIIAGIIITTFKDTATYYYGASSNEYRNIMAPYLLQWTAIKEAKEKGIKYYDFLGIAEPNSKNHPWTGVTEFKTKFGGEIISYARPQEYSFKKLPHFLYRITRFLV